MYVANCSLKYNPEDFTVVNKVLTLAGNTQLVGDAFVAHHCGGLLLDGGVFAEQKVDGKYVVSLVDETPISYIKAKCSLLCDGDAFEIVDGALSLKAVEPSGFDITWDGNIEGLESFYGCYKVTDDLHGLVSEIDLIGASVNVVENTETTTEVLTSDNIQPIGESNKLFAVMSDEYSILILIAFEDVMMGADLVKQGIWLKHVADSFADIYVSRLYKA